MGEMLDTLIESNRNYSALLLVTIVDNLITGTTIINDEPSNKITVNALCSMLLFDALKNKSMDVGHCVGMCRNNSEARLTFVSKYKYFFEFEVNR